MFLKLYFLISIYHQIIKIKCVNYAEIEKFSKSIIREPDTSGKIFFYLQISDFSKNSNIYIKFTRKRKFSFLLWICFNN